MEEYSHSSEATDAENYSSTTPPAAMRKKRSTRNKRRFSDEQIKSLESMFQTESRLEPVKKMQLARELGLHPRQVAIWFQNKRARWKSKQLERDYTILRANYNCLASRFDALKKEKQALIIQLQMLNDQIKKPPEETQDKGANSMCNESENGNTNRCEPEAKLSPSTERSENVLGVVSDGDSTVRAEEYFCLEDEPGLLNFVKHADGTLKPAEDWDNFDSSTLLGQSTSDYQLWDFWS